MKNLIAFAGIAALGYYLYNKYENNNSNKELASQPGTWPLKRGANNNLVKEVQKALINRGGDTAHLVLSAGGATGVFNEQTEKALTTLGYPAQLNQEHYNMLIADSKVLRNVAYVIDVDGATLFTGVGNNHSQEYGYGRDPFTHLPVRTHLGTSTGNYKNGLVELTTNINVKRVKFWVPTDKVAMVSQAEYDMMKTSKILEKSDDVKSKLLKL
ncbi:hypothetical protein KDU71_02580 [Carboxylicivirga sediminis]|uniref:Uncharacterized protein n=1 Tax=Carboxylicivirga sediminis TaxID=2006564 RepID=A0A941EZY5_9BACT|nr:hypothetical protein [Carboxylicivirga sediminis]MBR8534431.1 hypothetical protein [Carboxylicivirga sediminis]